MDNSFQTSADTSKLDTAMAKAQGEFRAAVKDKVNPFFKSKYADLESVFESCRASLAKYEISITQWLADRGDDRLHMVTRLAHKGEWIASRMAVPVNKQDPQGYKSASTYARRMALVAALGISEEDDDANGAVQSLKNPEVKKQASTSGPKPEKKASEDHANKKQESNPPLEQKFHDNALHMEKVSKHAGFIMKVGAFKGLPLYRWPLTKIPEALQYLSAQPKVTGLTDAERVEHIKALHGFLDDAEKMEPKF
jgi:hypothetical protein